MPSTANDKPLLEDDMEKPLISQKTRRKLKVPHKRRILYGIAALLNAVILTLGICLIVQSIQEDDTNINEQSVKRSQANTILLWDPFDNNHWQLPHNITYCKAKKNCFITNQHNYRTYNEFDAIVFDAAPGNYLNKSLLQDQRSSYQYFVFAAQNMVRNSPYLQQNESNFYNLTVTYKRNSSIVWRKYYIDFINQTEPLLIAHLGIMPIRWREPPVQFTYHKSIGRKRLAMIERTAPCRNFSSSAVLLEELSAYDITVDAYGVCGTMPYAANSTASMLHKYKFYLAFEDAFCSDQVMPGFYEALQANVIPVVFGGADYERFAPPRSYINAADFGSARELAEYLIYLDNNSAEYQKYFWWMEVYQVVGPVSQISLLCEICAFFQLPRHRRDHFVLENKRLFDWWHNDGCHKKSGLLT